MKKKQNIALAALLGLVLVFASCNNPIALGKRLNLDPPVVTISSPIFMESITGDLIITGTARDNEEVMYLFVTVERVGGGAPWKQEWRGDRNIWSRRNSENADYRPENGRPDTIYWDYSKGKGNVEWSICIDQEDFGADGEADGEYLISVYAENNVKNTGATVQVRIIVDTNGPFVTILNLELDDTPDAISAFQLKDPSVIHRLHNGKISIQYAVEDLFSIDTLIFQLIGEGNDEYYYNAAAVPIENPGWYGTFDINGNEILHLDGTPFDDNDNNDKALVRLLSIATDKAGNKREIDNHGWLVWWPAADKPWVDGVGVTEQADAEKSTVYPGSSVQGQAFDNEGVKSVSLKIYSIDNLTEAVHTQTWENEPTIEGSDALSSFFSWEFSTPTLPGIYQAVIDCEDINGKKGDTEIRYFYVQDVAAPRIDSISNPNSGITLFGDRNGNFTVTGTVSDGVDPVRLTIVWLNPANPDKVTSLINYQIAGYPGWDLLEASPGSSDKDSGGNIIWELDMDSFTPYSGEGDERLYKNFSTGNINLFDDLGIIKAGIPLSAQTFILRLQGFSGRSVTKVHSVRGDIEPPEARIERIEIWDGGSKEPVYKKRYTREDLDSGTMLDALVGQGSDETVGNSVYIFGTWNDDSYEAWQSERGMNIKVTWNGVQIPGTVIGPPQTGDKDADQSEDGKWGWQAGPLILTEEQAERGGGRIEVSVQDPAGTETRDVLTVRADTTRPRLMFISSEEPNGAYKKDKEIIIFLEFNKAVRLEGNTLPPVLTLNTGAPANYVHPGGYEDARHEFKYVVQDGHNVAKLDVTSINLFGGTWSGDALADIPKGNLGSTKAIAIDTEPPLILSVSSLSGSDTVNFFKAPKTLYLQVTFSEAINFTPGNTVAELKLNSGGSGLLPSVHGNNSLLFTYAVGPGDNTRNLLAEEFILNDSIITDFAGNTLASFVVPGRETNNNITTSGKLYIIDNEPPLPPLIKGIEGGTEASPNSYSERQYFYLESIEPGETHAGTTTAGARAEYSINGKDGPWYDYAPRDYASIRGMEFSAIMRYALSVRQIDEAGNVGEACEPVYFKIEFLEELIQGLSGSPSGTYTMGVNNLIEIRLNLRDNVKIEGADADNFHLTLSNRTGVADNAVTFLDGRRAGYAGLTMNNAPIPASDADLGNTGNSIVFRYLVQAGDNVALLEFRNIVIDNNAVTIKNEPGGSDLREEFDSQCQINWDSSQERRLSHYTSIKIKTGIPRFEGAEITGEKLVLSFKGATGTEDVFKQKGTVTLTQQGEYLAPAVMTKAEFLRWGGIAGSTDGTIASGNIGAYYEAGINGLTAANAADTTEKYILKYDIEPNNSNLTALLKAKDAHIVKVDVVSSAVTKTAGTAGGPLDQLTVDLSAARGYQLKVKGVNYELIFPHTLIQDDLQNSLDPSARGEAGFTVDAAGNYIMNVDNPGANVSFIRIKKARERIIDRNAIEQPYTADVRIDTQTPNATVKYWYNETPTAPLSGTGGANFNYNVNTGTGRPAAPTVTMPNAAGTERGSGTGSKVSFTLRSGDTATSTNPRHGYLYGITATANNGHGDSGAALGKVARSVISFYEVGSTTNENSDNPDEAGGAHNWSILKNLAGSEKTLHLWIRGGDRLSGANQTPGFPLSWSDSDYGGIRIMSGPDTAGNYKVWVSWEVDVSAYFHFIAGTVADAAAAASGPEEWSWAKNAWAFQHDKYPLHPGGSMEFAVNTRAQGQATERFEFFNTFSGERTGPVIEPPQTPYILGTPAILLPTDYSPPDNDPIVWTVSNGGGTGASITGTGPYMFTATAEGTATVTAAIGGIPCGAFSIAVVMPALVGAIPATATAGGANINLPTATNPVTGAVTWLMGTPNPTGSSVTTAGVFTPGNAAGTAVVRANIPGVGTKDFNIVISLPAIPDQPFTVIAGATLGLPAATVPPTGAITWTVANQGSTGAVITGSGPYTFIALKTGTATIQASIATGGSPITGTYPVTVTAPNIGNVPSEIYAGGTPPYGLPLSYQGSQNITWEVFDQGSTGAVIIWSNRLQATAGGTAVIRASVEIAGVGTITLDFNVTVLLPVIGGVPVKVAINSTNGLPIRTTEPSDASYDNVSWIMQDAGGTGSTVENNQLVAGSTGGTVTIRALISGVQEALPAFDFQVEINAGPVAYVVNFEQSTPAPAAGGTQFSVSNISSTEYTVTRTNGGNYNDWPVQFQVNLGDLTLSDYTSITFTINVSQNGLSYSESVRLYANGSPFGQWGLGDDRKVGGAGGQDDRLPDRVGIFDITIPIAGAGANVPLNTNTVYFAIHYNTNNSVTYTVSNFTLVP